MKTDITCIKDALEYIEAVPWTACAPGLDRMRAVLKKLGDPHKELNCIHIAGTNGKGSVAAMLDSVLRCSGYRTGLFTSPHLVRYNERMKISGQEISDEELTVYARRVQAAEQELAPLCLSVFEKLTAIGFLWFRDKGCDPVILETGLGGELDSTNVIEHPLISVITAIGFDHMALLGTTLPEISKAKAGIIKESCRTVVLKQEEQILDVFKDRAQKLSSKLTVADPNDLKLISQSTDSMTVQAKGYEGLIRLSLIGSYQLSNLSLVLSVIEDLSELGYPVTQDNVMEGLRTVQWPARFEIMCHSPLMILDGAHNSHGIRAAVDALTALFPNRKITYITGMLKDKEIDSMLSMLFENAGCFYAITPESSRACDADELASRIRSHGFKCIVAQDIISAVDMALRDAGTDDIICALGSLYMAGTVREYLKKG